MKAKYFLVILFVFLLLVGNSRLLKAQEELDFEEFMGMVSETFTDQQLDELSYQLPWNIKVTAYGYGDYSGNDRNDVVLAIREIGVTPKNSVDVYFFENIGDTTYELIKKKNIKYIELNIEVAFLVKDGLCYVTHRDENSWYFTSYNIKDESLVKVDEEVFPISVGKAGE